MAGFSATHETANFFSLKAEGLLTDDLKWNNMNSIGSKENYNASTKFRTKSCASRCSCA